MQGENDTDSRDTNQIRILRERIAELEASVAELAKARKESDLIIELVPDLIAVASTDGYFKRLNPAWEETLGFTTDELLSKPFVNFIHPDDVERTMKEVEQQLSGERTICFENRYLCRNGEYKWLEWVATPVVDNTLLFATARDITERKKSETALREGEERFRKLFDTSHDVIVFLDREGNIMDINHHGEELTHYTRAELLRMNAFSDLILPEDHLIMRNVVRDAFEGRESRYVERWKARDGKIIYFDGLTVPQRSSGGDVLSTFCSLRDITQHKMSDDALKASEERFRAISSAAVDAVILTDSNGRIVYWNAASERMFGYPSEEAIGQDLHLLLAPAKYHEDFKKGFDRFRRTGQGLSIGNTMEFTAIRKDGSEFPIEVSTSAILIDGLWSAVGIVRDVTERTKAEDALRASEEELHYNYLLQSAVNMILSESLKEVSLETILQKALNIVVSIPEFSFEPIGCILLVEDEPGILKMKARSNLVEPDAKLCDAVPFGWCFCGRAAADRKLLFADHMDTRHEICHTAMPQHGHYAVPILFGGRTMGLLNIYLREGHVNSEKEEEFLLTVANNLAGIIMRRRAEEEKERLGEQLLQAQKMEAIGQLAGGIAHDFNNILTAMIGYGHLLKIKMEEDDPLRNYVEHILLLSDRAASLTQGLLAFSRKQIMNPEAVDLNAVIRRVERLLERII
ncbi:MAG TPA: PAS domain S-box protein, partial [Thermodesulfovibrionales bacterium]|nr:PAS domain S-box protein [Thermodesulfovibrionales bacterium]